MHWLSISNEPGREVRLYVRLTGDCLEFRATMAGKPLTPVRRMDRAQFRAFSTFAPTESGDWLRSVEEESRDKFRAQNRNHICIVIDGKSIGHREFADFWNLVREELGGNPWELFSTESVYVDQENSGPEPA